MKFISKRKANQDNQHTVYCFESGKEELLLILAMVDNAKKYTPKTIENIPTKGRLNEIKKKVSDALKNL